MKTTAGLPRWHAGIGARLLLLFLALALATAFIFLAGMQRALAGGWTVVLRPLVADYVDRLAADIGSPPSPQRAQALVQRLPISVRIEGPQLQWDSHPQHRDFDERQRRRAEGPGEDGRWLLVRSTADGHRITFGLGDGGWRQRPRFIGWLTLAALLGFTALAYAYSRHLLRPLADIRAGAQRYGRGEFDAPIPVRRADELGVLAEQVNRMAQALQRMLQAQHALLLAVSHELRSPLTRARLHAELLDEGPQRDALLRDLGEMGRIINDLLENERLAGGAAALQREPSALNALVRALVAEEFGAAHIQLDLADGLPSLPLDRSRVRLLLRNLLANALHHGTPAPQPPCVRSFVEAGSVCLELRDFGPGVSDGQLAQLGQAFYRADAARQRSTGGVGLGLSMCRLVAQAHGGELRFAQAKPGLSVQLRLPLG